MKYAFPIDSYCLVHVRESWYLKLKATQNTKAIYTLLQVTVASKRS